MIELAPAGRATRAAGGATTTYPAAARRCGHCHTARARRDRVGNHILEVDLPWVEQHVEFVVRSIVEQTPADVEHP